MRNRWILNPILVVIFGAFLAIFGSTKPVFACLCRPHTDFEGFFNASAVFSGKVIRVDAVSPTTLGIPANAKFTFKVDRSWKGVNGDQAVLYAIANSAFCGIGFELNRDYVIYAHGPLNELTTSGCSHNAPDSEAGFSNPDVLFSTTGAAVACVATLAGRAIWTRRARPSFMRWLFGGLFVVTYAVATAGIGILLDWYDTGKTDGGSAVAGLIGGTLSGCAALVVERWIHQRRGIWPAGLITFYARQVVHATLAICIGFFVLGCFYMPFALPFSLVVAAITTLLLRRTSVAGRF